MIRKFLAFIFTVLFLSLTADVSAAGKGTILFVPLDNRPVCLEYSVNSMAAAGWNVETPPEEYIASNEHSGNPDKLYEWLAERAPLANAVIVSSDAMLYGGLVDSRTHHIERDVLKARAERLVGLKDLGGDPLVYVFTTIMRSPRASAAPVEPPYYAEWGSRIFQLGELEDREDLKEITRRERKDLKRLLKEIPPEVRADNMQRRALNIEMTELLLHGVESGDFDYLLIGRDDTAPFSQAHKEARKMGILVSELPKERIRFFAGADQLGMVLLNRAANRISYEIPMVYAAYGDGKGKDTIPSYEDDPVDVSVKEHIHAVGGWPTKYLHRADMVLLVNTPSSGVTLEASAPSNNGVAGEQQHRFMRKLDYYQNQAKPVAVADIAYGNGADNALVKELFAEGKAYELAAYGGWNTAGNTIGFALAQGLLAPDMTVEAKDNLLNIRYLDDWAYQANVRMKVSAELIWPNKWPNSGLNAEQLIAAEKQITKDITEVAAPLMTQQTVDAYRFNLPWQRMFEVRVSQK